MESDIVSLHRYSIPATLKSTSVFYHIYPPTPPFFNPLYYTSNTNYDTNIYKAQPHVPSLRDLSFVFQVQRHNQTLEKDLSRVKQVDVCQALSSIHSSPMLSLESLTLTTNWKKVSKRAVVAHNLDCREEAQAEKRDYIELADTSMRAILNRFLARSSSNPKSTYEAAASLSNVSFTKILIDKMEKNKSYDKADYKRELYDALRQKSDPPLRSDRGRKRKKSSMEVSLSRDPRSKKIKSSSTLRRTLTLNKSLLESCRAEEQVLKLMTRECNIDQAVRQRTLVPSFDELMDTSFDFSAFVLNRHNIKDLNQEILVGPTFELLKGTCKSLTELEYHFKEYHRGHQVIPQDFFINKDLEYLKGGDLSRRYLTSVTKTKAATYEIKWIEDLVRNLSNLRTAQLYTAYSDPKGVIYKDQNNRNRLMRADELHKFSDGTLNDVRTALHDIAKGIRMEYLPKRKWSGLDKRRA
ncbi:hypothetical protein Tco_1406717 [Tanacetum coccineum]